MQTRLKSLIKKVFGVNFYQALVRMKNAVAPVRFWFREPRLREIGLQCRTDKVDFNHAFQGRTYLDIYEEYFKALRRNKVSVLEIGVKGGASLRTWKAYFPHADIFGLDIDPECKRHEEDRIHIEIGSQDDVPFLERCFGGDRKFDVIIDDGSHVNRHIITSFETLFYKRLNPGGIYILEDLRTSYQALQTNHDVLGTWAGMKYNDPTQNYDNDREEMNRFFFDKIRELDYARGDILSLHFWSMVCILIKCSKM